jgi:hypothetical protein
MELIVVQNDLLENLKLLELLHYGPHIESLV